VLTRRSSGRNGRPVLREPVLPARLPAEGLPGEVFQGHAVDHVIQSPAGGDMADDQDSRN
jgi:hypothetical protein